MRSRHLPALVGLVTTLVIAGGPAWSATAQSPKASTPKAAIPKAAGHDTRHPEPGETRERGGHAGVAPSVLATGVPDPRHLAQAPDGSWLVTSPRTGRVYRVGRDGGAPQVLYDRLRHPHGIAVSRSGEVFVAERTGDRIVRFAADGARAVVLDHVDGPRGLWWSPDGALYFTARRYPEPAEKAKHDEDEDDWRGDEPGGERGIVARLDVATKTVRVLVRGFVQPEALLAVADGPAPAVWLVAERRHGEGEHQGAALFGIGPAGTVTPALGPLLHGPVGLARDALGAFWFTARRLRPDAPHDGRRDAGANARGIIVKVTPEGGWHPLAEGLDDPAGLAFDANGDLVAAETGHRRLVRFRAPPAPQVKTPLPTNVETVAVEGIAEPDALVVARSPAGSAAGAANTEGRFAVTVPLLINQTNAIELFAVTAAGTGLASPPARLTIIQDGIPPALALHVPAQDALTNVTPLVARGNVSDANGPVLVRVNGEAAALDAQGGFAIALPLLEGQNRITVDATDTAANTTTLARDVFLDTIPPSISLVAGPESPTNNATITVTAGATDNHSPSGSIRFAFSLDSGTDYGPWGASATAGYTSLPDGEHTIRAKAQDQAGNESHALAVAIRVDTVPPVITLTAPDPGLLTNQPAITVAGAVADVSPPFEIAVNGQPATLQGSRFSHPLTLAEGANTITVSARDAAGNPATENRMVVLDTVRPAIAISAPAENALVPQTTITVTGVVADAHLPATVTVNRHAAPLTAEGQFSVEIAFPIAETQIAVVAADRAGNANSSSRTVIRDVTPPTIALVVRPPDPTKTADLSVTVSATDDVSPQDMLQFAFSLDSEVAFGAWGAATTATFPTVTDGPHTIYAKTRDQAGNESVPLSVDVRVDTMAPSVTLNAPAHLFLTNQPTMLVSGTVTDASAISGVTVNGQPVSLAGTSFTATVTLVEGANTLTASATDAAGNVGSAGVSGTLDTVGPVLSFTAPGAEAVLNTTPLPVTGTVSEAVMSVTVNGVAATVSGGTFSATIIPVRGPNTLTAQASDQAGNPGSATRRFTFDDVAPVVRILTPSSGQVLSQTSLTVTGAVDDASATVTVNEVAATVQGGLFTATGLPVGAGPVTLLAQAADPAGNVSTDQVTLTVDVTPPTIGTLAVPADVTAGTAVVLWADADDDLGLARLDLLVDGRLVASGTGAVSVSFTVPPDKPVNDTLAVTARAVDVAGQATTLLASMRVAGAAVGPGFLRGLVLDDAKGLPLPAATVTVTVEGGNPVDPQVTGADGQYAFTVDPGTARVRVVKEGMTLAERKVPVRSDLMSLVADARLTARDAKVTVIGTVGGVAADQANGLRLSVPSGGLLEDASITLTPVSDQGLIARLPLGWTPILVADIAPATLTLAAPGTLSVRLPEAWQPLLPAGTQVTVARYDPAPGVWVALEPASVTNDALAIEAAIDAGGQVALLLRDTAPQSPPTAAAGEALAGVAAVAIADDATATGSVAPGAIPPGGATAKGQVTVTPTAPLPSGTPIQAVVSEKYSLVSGEEATPPSFVQELVLYQCRAPSAQCLDGVLRTEFPVTPSKTYTLKELAIGTVHLAVQTPEAGGPGTVIGPDGGTLTASDGTILTIPAGALDRETVVALAVLAESDLRVAVPAGFQVLKAVTLDLTRATLSLSAELAFALPPGITADAQVLVARVLEVDGVLKLQAVGVGQVSGALLSSKGTVPDVTLPGVTTGGTYVALRAVTPIGFVAGTITDGTNTAKAGVVVSSGTGLVGVSGSDGRYLVAVTTGSTSITASDRATGQGASQAVTVSTAGATIQALQVQVIPPTIVRVTPAAAARNVPVNSTVSVVFSQAIARASLTAGSLVLSGPGRAVDATITLSPLGTEATIYPAKSLASQTTYSLVAAQTIQDTHGVRLAAPFTSQFTTANAPPPPPPAGAITVSFPDAQGNVTVTATQGTAPPDYLVVVLNVSSGTVASATVGANGGFTASLFAMLGDELLVMIQDSAGNQTVVSPGPYRSADGQFMMTRAGGSLDTPEGLRLTLAPAAVTSPVTMKVTPLTLDQTTYTPPAGLQFLGGLRLDTQGASFKTGAKVSLPVPGGVTIPPGAQPFLARLQPVSGQLTPVLVDTMRLVNGKLTTSSPPFPGVQKEGDYIALMPTNPYPAVVTGHVVREGASPAQPIAGAVLRVDGTEVVATTDDKGKYALELFPTDTTKPTTFNFLAVDPITGAIRGASLTVPAWTVPAGGGTYALDMTLPAAGAGRDTTPPKVELTVDAPSLRSGRVALGDTVTVTVKVSDDIGVRADTLTLSKNGTSIPLALSGGTVATTTIPTTTPWEVITVVATAEDTSGNTSRSEAAVQVTGGGTGGGGGIDVPPPAPADQPLKLLSAGTFPPDGTLQVDTGTSATLLFNQPVGNASADLLFLTERDLDSGAETTIEADVQVDPADPSLVTLKPTKRLRYRATYTIVAKAALQGTGGGTLGQDYESRFSTLDLTGPSIPVANGRDVVVLDKYAFILDRAEGLVTVDISDPSSPTILATTPVFTGPFAANQGLALAPDFTYIGATGQPVYAPAIVVVGWISQPQGGIRGMLRIFDLTDPIRPRRIGSATIARCTTGVPIAVVVRDQYAVVASLLQGLVVVDLSAVIGGSLTDGERPAAPSSGASVDYGTTLQVAGPVGMSLSDDARDAICEPGHPKGVVTVWNAGGQIQSPVTMKAYGTTALVGDVRGGVYRVALGNLPALDGTQVYAGPVFRLDVLPNREVVDPTTGEARRTDVVAIAAGDALVLADPTSGATLSRTTLPGAAFSILTDPGHNLLFAGTGQCVQAYDTAVLTDARPLGCNRSTGGVNGSSAVTGTGSHTIWSDAGIAAKVVQTAQSQIEITLYDGRDFGPVYDRSAQTLTFSLRPTEIPLNAPGMEGTQADGISILVVRATIPKNTKATRALFALADVGWAAITEGGLFPTWPALMDLREVRGQRRVVVDIEEVTRGTTTERIAVAIFHPPARFRAADGPTGAFLRHANVAVQTIEDRPLDAVHSIHVRRRPLILVHGYNSGPQTWEALKIEMSRVRELSGVTVAARVNYRDINTSGLDLIYRRLPIALDAMRADLREQKIAATQFDVLAHSMGGLATWMYVSDLNGVFISRPQLAGQSRTLTRSADEFFRQDSNYGTGTINRIITVGTPYRGSEVADRVLAFLNCTEMAPDIRACGPDPSEAMLRKAVRDWIGNGDLTAYTDFSASSLTAESSALWWLHQAQPSGVPIHTISGIATENANCGEAWLPLIRWDWSLPPESSDRIVSQVSARGGLEDTQTQTLAGVCHTQETGVRLIRSRPGQSAPLPQLLDDANGSERFYAAGLPRR